MNTNYLNYNELFNAYDEYIEDRKLSFPLITHNIDSFRTFLSDNKLSTAHAEELFARYQNPNKEVVLSKQEFKLRKQHPKRDALIKKVAIPATVVGGMVGLTMGMMSASNLIAGSRFLGILPVTSNAIVDFTAASIVGFSAGLVGTVGIITAKNMLTRLYYKARYGSAKKSIQELENGIEYENLAIAKLIERIEASNQRVLELKSGSKLTAPFRFIRRHAINAVNRNRIHHLEAYTKDLVKIFDQHATAEIDDKAKLAQLEPIHILLYKISEFIQNDIEAAKLNALLNCEQQSNHVHRDYIENLDIYTKLAMYLDCVDMLNPTTAEDKKKQTQQKRTYTTNKKNIQQQNTVAERLLNGENLLQRCAVRLADIEKSARTKKEIESYIVVDNSINVRFTDGTNQGFSDIDNPTEISTVDVDGKYLVITYIDGTTVQKSMVAKKPSKDIATEGTILRNLSDPTFVDELRARGFEDAKIEELRKELENRLKPTKKPKKLYGTPTFRNGNFVDIYNACLDIINTTKGLAV